MATDSGNQHNSGSSDEIDLRSLFEAIGNFFQSIFSGIINLILYCRNLLWKQKILIGSIGILFGVLYTFLEFKKRDYYKTSMVINSLYFRGTLIQNSFDNLNELCDEENYSVLAQKLYLDSAEASQLKSFSLDVVISDQDRVLYQRMLENIDPQENPELFETIRAELSAESQSTYKIVVEVYDTEVVPKLDSAIVKFLLDNEFIKKRIAISEQNLTLKMQSIAREESHLDSLQDIIYKNYQRLAEQNATGSNNVYVGGGEDPGIINPMQVYREKLRLIDELLSLRRLQFLKADVEIVDGFVEFNKSEAPGLLRPIVIGMFLGLVLGFGFALLLDFNQYLNKVEEKKKQAA